MTMLLLGDAFSCARIYVLISGGCHSALAVAPVKAFKVFAVPASFTLFGRLFQSLLNSYRSSFFQQVVRACCCSRLSSHVRSLEDVLAALTVQQFICLNHVHLTATLPEARELELNQAFFICLTS